MLINNIKCTCCSYFMQDSSFFSIPKISLYQYFLILTDELNETELYKSNPIDSHANSILSQLKKNGLYEL